MKLIGKFISGFALFGASIILNFILYDAITTGEIRRQSRTIQYEVAPIEFITQFGFILFLSLLTLVLIIISCYTSIDKKIAAYGNNYNLNTFKAILRGKSK